MERVRPSRARLLLGALLGLGLLIVTLAQVDIVRTARLIAVASPALLGLALAVVLIDLVLRAVRWQGLLRGAGAERGTGLRLPLAYMTVGYLANQLLPARLGDLARAYLAGQAFAMPRLAALGTIVVERLADGSTMLVLALASTALVSGIAVVADLALLGAVLAISALGALAVGWSLVGRTRLGRLRPARALTDLVARLAVGMGGMRTFGGAAHVVGLTVAITITAGMLGWLVVAAVGIALTPLQTVLFVSAIAMSLAIPAAPAAIGTYEFVGVLVLTSMGVAGEEALAAVLLLRIISSLPAALLGLGSVWALHLRTAQLIQPDRLAAV